MESSSVPGVKFPNPIPIPNLNVTSYTQIKVIQELTRALNDARNSIAALQWRVSILEDRLDKD